MATLKQFFSQTIPKNKNVEMPLLSGKSIIITQVALTQPLAEGTRASLKAQIETIQIGQQEENEEVPPEVVIAHFFSGNQLTQQTCLGFTNADIVFFTAEGAEMIISGYSVPSFEKLSNYT